VNDVVKPLQESVIKQAELIKKVIPGFLARICSTLVSSKPDLSKSSAE
jgi:hypothetical protein